MISPLVSISCITYNHENFIREALDGFLMQKTTFAFEIIIHDDASHDRTAKIIQEYEVRFPNIIFPIYQSENQYSKGINPGNQIIIPKCRGKYIAICEGDDYWTDPYKLQKQVDFLEANPGFSLCFHNSFIKHEGLKGKDRLFCKNIVNEITDIKDVIETWYIPSASMVFRNELISPLPDWFNDIYNGDYALHLLLAHKGKIKYFNEVMSVYRKNSGALSGGVAKNFIYVNNEIIKLLNYFDIYSHYVYNDNIKKRILVIEKENSYLRIRNKYPIYKYFNKGIWISKIKSILNKHQE